MTMDDMVERVAKALCDDTLKRWRTPIGVKDEPWREFIPAARAAIEAMRVPTKAMIDAAVALERELNAMPIAAWATVDEDYMGMKWQVMIDKSLRA